MLDSCPVLKRRLSASFVLVSSTQSAHTQPTRNASGVRRRYSGNTRTSSHFAGPSTLVHPVDRTDILLGALAFTSSRGHNNHCQDKPRGAASHVTRPRQWRTRLGGAWGRCAPLGHVRGLPNARLVLSALRRDRDANLPHRAALRLPTARRWRDRVLETRSACPRRLRER